MNNRVHKNDIPQNIHSNEFFVNIISEMNLSNCNENSIYLQ